VILCARKILYLKEGCTAMEQFCHSSKNPLLFLQGLFVVVYYFD
jgi:hypothetical protein